MFRLRALSSRSWQWEYYNSCLHSFFLTMCTLNSSLSLLTRLLLFSCVLFNAGFRCPLSAIWTPMDALARINEQINFTVIETAFLWFPQKVRPVLDLAAFSILGWCHITCCTLSVLYCCTEMNLLVHFRSEPDNQIILPSEDNVIHPPSIRTAFRKCLVVTRNSSSWLPIPTIVFR